jgi:hypothetical protein
MLANSAYDTRPPGLSKVENSKLERFKVGYKYEEFPDYDSDRTEGWEPHDYLAIASK